MKNNSKELKDEAVLLDLANELYTNVSDITATSGHYCERTCGLCGEHLSGSELYRGVCGPCKDEREDLDSDAYLSVDVFMHSRGQYENTAHRQADPSADARLNEDHDGAAHEDDVPSM